MKTPLFAGLVVDEDNRAVEIENIGNETFYVIDDAGFKRHIPSKDVDKQVLNLMKEQISGNELLLSEQAAKMLGQEDIFSVALISNQLKNLDKQFDLIIDQGIPEESRAYLGMTGFKIVINLHGEIVEVIQPTSADTDE